MKKILATLILALFLVNLASALTISSVSTSPAEVSPGQKFSVSFTIENNNADDAENVQVFLDLSQVPFAPYQSSAQASIDEIRSDKSKDFDFELISNSDAKSSTYKIPVKISYTLNAAPVVESGIISAIVSSSPILSVSAEDTNLIKGQQATLKIRLTNSGLGDAKLLSIKILAPSSLKIIGSDNAYIGNINSDDFDTAEFKVFVNSNAGSSVSVPIEVSYTNSRNVQKIETLEMSIKTYTTDEAISLGIIQKNNTGLIVTALVILVILYLIYRALRKRLKRKN